MWACIPLVDSYILTVLSESKSQHYVKEAQHNSKCTIKDKAALSGLEKFTRPLVFTSASGCRASATLNDFQCKLTFFPYMPIIFVMQGKCLFQDISKPVYLLQQDDCISR